MNDLEGMYLKQAAKLDHVEEELREARELVLLLAGQATISMRKPGKPCQITVESVGAARSVRVERVEGGVRFHINEGSGDDGKE